MGFCFMVLTSFYSSLGAVRKTNEFEDADFGEHFGNDTLFF